jgi:hypothetical protein
MRPRCHSIYIFQYQLVRTSLSISSRRVSHVQQQRRAILVEFVAEISRLPLVSNELRKL